MDNARIVEIELPPDDEVRTTNRGRVIGVLVPDPNTRFKISDTKVGAKGADGTFLWEQPDGRGRGFTRKRDRQLIAHTLYREGLSYAQIALALGVSERQVTNYIAELLARWDEERRADENRHRATTSLELDWIKRQARAAWERSKTEEITGTKKTIEKAQAAAPGKTAPAPDVTNATSVTRRQRVGDPRFLDRFAWAVETEIKLYGLNAPEKKQVELKASADLLKELMEQAQGVADAGGSDPRVIEMQKWLGSAEGQPTQYLPVMKPNGVAHDEDAAFAFDATRKNGRNGSGE
jgi:predicted transcriptional regulator